MKTPRIYFYFICGFPVKDNLIDFQNVRALVIRHGVVFVKLGTARVAHDEMAIHFLHQDFDKKSGSAALAVEFFSRLFAHQGYRDTKNT